MTIQSDEKLEEIHNLISDYLASGRDLLVSTQKLLLEIQDKIGLNMNLENTVQEDQVIIISCDASIKTNPGGPAAVGVIIRYPDGTKPTSINRAVPALTNNEAEYDAIYEGLMHIANLVNRPKFPICIRSDSQLVVKQLRGEYKINLDVLQRKYDSIHALAGALPVPVIIEWHPRNSTPDLTEANFIAQDAIGVKRH
jgi:ribonuclease HI